MKGERARSRGRDGGAVVLRAGIVAPRALAGTIAALALAACSTTIESGLPEDQANQVVVALDRHGIGAAKTADGTPGSAASYSVWVAADDVAGALAVLRAEDLPHRPDPGFAEVFGEGSLVPTATEERARLTAALGGELARSIESIDGVLDARVHVALADSSELLLDAPAPRPRASVLIRYRGDRAPYSDDAIRSLVAGAIQGMELADVAIVGVAATAAPSRATHLASVGPIAVARGSASTLKLVLGVLLGTNAALATLLALVVVRRRRAAGAAST